MKLISKKIFEKKFEEQLIYANFNLRHDILSYFEELYNNTKDNYQKEILKIYIENNTYANNDNRALCQDTGYVQIYLEIGNNVCLNFDIENSINKIVENVYRKYYLRLSISDSITRINTNKNTPSFIDYEYYMGNYLKVYILIKGGGSENSTKCDLLLPTSNMDHIYDWVVKKVNEIGSKSCPPYYIGVCIGGNLEKSVYWSKKILLTEINKNYGNENEKLIALELKKRINETNIGFQGLKFLDTAIDVKVKLLPCHIATLPIAMTIQCNAIRQGHFII